MCHGTCTQTSYNSSLAKPAVNETLNNPRELSGLATLISAGQKPSYALVCALGFVGIPLLIGMHFNTSHMYDKLYVELRLYMVKCSLKHENVFRLSDIFVCYEALGFYIYF